MVPELNKEIFFNLIPDLMCIAGRDGTLLDVNDSFGSILGYKKEELIGKPALAFMHPDDLNVIRCQIKEVIAGNEKPNYFESRYRRKDGTYIWLSWVVRICNDYFYGTARDITDSKHRHQSTEKNEKLLRALVHQSPACITMLDRDMRLIASSKKILEEFNVTEDEIIGKSIYEAFPETAVPRKSVHAELLKGKRHYNEALEIQHKSGKSAVYEATFEPWYEEDGVTIGGVISLMNNITEKSTWEIKLKKDKQLIDGLLKNLPIVIFRYDKNGIVHEVDGTALERLGFTREFALGACIFELYPEYHELKDVLKGRVQYFTTRENHKEPYFFQNYVYPDEITGGAVGISFDITQQWLISKELAKAKEQAEKANKAKTHFLASMSHEIRTPINAILGFADVLSRQDLPPAETEYVDFIKSAGASLIKIIGDILDLSKIEEGRLEVERSCFNLKSDLVETLFPYRFRAAEVGLKFSIHIDEFLPAKLVGDLTKIRQILINLISNSLKFTRQGGISVRFTNDKLLEETDEILLKIEVADTGIGISSERQSQVFSPFVQADPSVSKEFGGSGLGLAIVHQLVELMQGEIRVMSPSNMSGIGGPGTTFEILLKLEVPKGEFSKKENVSPEKTLKPGIKVLVAEDNLMNRKLIEVLLSTLGCDSCFAENGQDALEKFSEGGFDLILMDVQMPVMDGLQASKTIRKKNASVPIIGVTANVYKEDVDNCFDAGMNDFLGKPFSIQQLKDVLLKWSQ